MRDRVKNTGTKIHTIQKKENHVSKLCNPLKVLGSVLLSGIMIAKYVRASGSTQLHSKGQCSEGKLYRDI